MARRSGEEFLALRRVRDADAADRIAAQIRNRLAARRFLCGGQEVRLTVHVGGVVAVGPAAAPLGDAVPALLQVAERVLREARAARSHVRIARFLANQHGTWVGKRVVPSVLRDHGTHRRVQDGKRADTPPRPYGRLLRRSWFDR
jgi:xanthine dehydrogenase iron-sulfur cluster and FAD-binding subunit A